MAKPRNQRQQRAQHARLEKAYSVCALGLGMLLIPKFMGNSPIGNALSNGLRTPGWLALGLGLVLLAAHHMSKEKTLKAAALPGQPTKPQRSRNRAPIPSLAEVLRELDEPTRPPLAPQPAPVRKQIREINRQPARRSTPLWSQAVFAAIEWRRFEAVCEKLFAQGGFQTQSQSHGADGGVDIWLHSRHAEGPVAVVQCKHWHTRAVGVKELREFFGVMASHKLARGTFATSSTYTSDAQQFARDNGINALDGGGLLSLIATRTPEQQQELLDIAFEGEYWKPTCASCGIKMVERIPSKGGIKFWGCGNYPRCKSRMHMSTSVL